VGADPNIGAPCPGFPLFLPTNTLLLLGHEDTSSTKVHNISFLAEKPSIVNTILFGIKYGGKTRIPTWITGRT
jgi:hypothetical protein